ncbi:MAG: RlmE family RNA methyltransferase [Promethearchaeota archaeon]
MTKNPKRHRNDPHYKQAKRENYRARSAFKLLDINKRFNIFKRAFYILDLGSTPGSWLQVARQIAEENLEKYNDGFYHKDHFRILGVDIKPISPIEGVNTIRMDFTSQGFMDEIRNYFGKNVDLLLSDASIKKSGIKFSDDINQIKLCYKILDIAKKFLKQKGSMVLKVFQGSDYNEFYMNMKKQFKFLKSYKPKSSRKDSNEIYLVGLIKLR